MALAARVAVNAIALQRSDSRKHSQRNRDCRHPIDASYQLVAEYDSDGSLDGQDGRDVSEPTWRRALGQLLSSNPFQIFISLLIIANALVLGMETDDRAKQPWWGWNVLEHTFLALFALELGLKFCVKGNGLVCNTRDADFAWNVFDLVIVGVGCVDVSIDLVYKQQDENYALLLRLIRLARILRIFRLVRFLKQLYMLAFGFGMAAVAVFWVTILMTFVLYVSSIVLVRTVGSVPEDDPNHDIMHEHFGTMADSMLTLFTLLAVPDLNPYMDMLHTYPAFLIFLISFVVFGSFGLIGLLTGVIMESMFEKNEVRREEEMKDSEMKRTYLIETLHSLFEASPHLPSGEISIDQLKEMIPDVARLLRSQGIHLSRDDLDNLPGVIDGDRSGTISKEEFSEFIVCMTEGVRPMLLLKQQYGIAELRHHIDESVDRLSRHHSKEMARLRSLVETALSRPALVCKATGQLTAQTSSIPVMPGVKEQPAFQRTEDSCVQMATGVIGQPAMQPAEEAIIPLVPRGRDCQEAAQYTDELGGKQSDHGESCVILRQLDR
eukprot:TRINITY_DN68523_c0_g1_i1.p1 TRINITY_DN68523_c0_g1~~TRINITY_DN68523_c0_g1_i1.p1  ORF type:complete len:551 (+),score=94.59 TRINITY_DN68523_c0_g1_i1:99-1751(+)